MGSQCAFAQRNPVIDSLRHRLNTASADSQRAVLFNEISWAYMEQSGHDTALLYAGRALQLASRKNIPSVIAKAYGNIGAVHLSRGHFREALQALFASLEIRTALGDLKGQANLYTNIGLVYFRQSNLAEAQKYFMQALKTDQVRQDSTDLSQDYRDIGMVYRRQGENAKALDCYFKALNIQQALRDSVNLSITHNNIGSAFSELGAYSKALQHIDTAIALLGTHPEKYIQALGFYHQNAAITLRDSGAYRAAHQHLEQARQRFEALEDLQGLAGNFVINGKMLLKEGKNIPAKTILLEALRLQKQTHNLQGIQDVYQLLAVADSSLGLYKSALNYYQRYALYKDSTTNEAKIRELTSQQMTYEFSQKEDSILMANQKVLAVKDATVSAQKKQKWGMGAGIGLLGVIGGMLVYQNRRQKRNNRTLSHLNTELDASARQNQLLMKEMHHRIKNNLYVVCGLLDIQSHHAPDEDTEQILQAIRQRIQCIATTHEQLYLSTPDRISAKEYLEKFVANILYLLGATDAVATQIEVDSQLTLQPETCVPMAMLLNEWLTNTVKYTRSETGNTRIFIRLSGNETGEAALEYADSGGHFPEITGTSEGGQPADKVCTPGIGSRIIQLLARQLRGKLQTDYQQQPFHYHIVFPVV